MSSYAEKMDEATTQDYAFRESSGCFNKEQGARLRAYLRRALEKSGKTQADVNRHIGSFMAGHYFGASQWEFPTREVYKKLQEILPIDDYDKVVKQVGGASLLHNGKIYGYEDKTK